MQAIIKKLKNGIVTVGELFVLRLLAFVRIIFGIMPDKPKENELWETPSVVFINDDERPMTSVASSLGHTPKKRATTRHRSTTFGAAAKRQTKLQIIKRKSSKIVQEPRHTTAKSIVNLSTGTTLTCNADHEGRLLLKTNLELAVDKLFEMLFTSKSKFLTEFHKMRNTKELQMGEWHQGQNGEKSRVVSMIVALTASIGPKSAKVIESHTMRACSAKGELYSIDVESVNEGVPHADVFTIFIHYCLARSNNNTTDVQVFGNVNFIKSTWAVVKAFITKHSYEGMAEFFHSLNAELVKEADKKKAAH